MINSKTLQSEDFKECADFHGHTCPGLAIGYREAKAALDRLDENRSFDEEIVAIVETDACSADAIQVLTGCTFGKGNFLFNDYGKQVLTLVSRKSGNGVRVALKPQVIFLSDEHRDLIDKIRDDEATEEERERFWQLHREKAEEILKTPMEDLFTIRSANVFLPEKARIEPSKSCDHCGEPTMGSKLSRINGQYLCRDCLGED